VGGVGASAAVLSIPAGIGTAPGVVPPCAAPDAGLAFVGIGASAVPVRDAPETAAAAASGAATVPSGDAATVVAC
jgi:hypothetical protein